MVSWKPASSKIADHSTKEYEEKDRPGPDDRGSFGKIGPEVIALVHPIASAPRALAPVLAALRLDAQGWDRAVDRLLASRRWPILVAVAERAAPPADPGVAAARTALRRGWRRIPAAWRLALRGRLALYSF